MKKVKMYHYKHAFCPYCDAALKLLQRRGYTEVESVYVDIDAEKLAEMAELTGRRTVPQIFLDAEYVGGYQELLQKDKQGHLREGTS